MEDKGLLKLLLSINEKDILAKQLFLMETQYGFPIEASLEELGIKYDHNIFGVIANYLILKTEHSLKSGMEFMGKRHLKLIENNKEVLKKLITI